MLHVVQMIFNYMDNVRIMMFADECVLYKSGEPWDDIHMALQESLNVYI